MGHTVLFQDVRGSFPEFKPPPKVLRLSCSKYLVDFSILHKNKCFHWQQMGFLRKGGQPIAPPERAFTRQVWWNGGVLQTVRFIQPPPPTDLYGYA